MALWDYAVWLLLVFFTIGFLLYRYGKRHHGQFKRLGIPGPAPKLFFGSMGVYGKKYLGLVDLQLLQEYGDVVGVFEGSQPVVLVKDPEILKEILVKDFTEFSDRRVFPMRELLLHSLFDIQTVAAWRRQRHILSPYFSTSKLKQKVLLISKCCDNLLSNVTKISAANGTFDAKEMMGAFTLDAICSTGFGIQIDSQNNPHDPFLKVLKQLMAFPLTSWKLMVIFLLPHIVPILEKMGVSLYPPGAIDFFKKNTNDAIKLRKESNEDSPDFIQAMTNAYEEHLKHKGSSDDEGAGLNLTEVQGNAMLFLIAGYETTATTLAFLLHMLATHSEIQDKVIEEVDTVMDNEGGVVNYNSVHNMPYLDVCINETLRLFPPVARVDRKPIRNLKVKDTIFLKNTVIQIPIYALHHHPDLWPDPETFDPTRFLDVDDSASNSFSFLPFGVGPRHCIGMRLAQMEMKMVVTRLLSKFRVDPCEKTKPVELSESSFFLVAKEGNWVKPVPR